MIFNGNNQQNNGRFLSFNIDEDRFQNAFIIFWFELTLVNLEIFAIQDEIEKSQDFSFGIFYDGRLF